ncbi:MAG: TonB-dependent receptor [Acidobacteria bacterium]|nr:TonB-dependent receptor [Acidobacteriota bacterium]
MLACTFPSFGQIGRASLAGRVEDPQLAGVTNARVTATHTGTNQTLATFTDALGNYLFPALSVGAYRVQAELSGFKTFVREGIVLQVDQRSRVDMRLELGETAQRIEVVSSTVPTETESSALGQVIENKRVVELPLNGRNPLELMRLAAGVRLQGSAFLDTANFNLTSVSINGGQGGTNAMLLDGASLTLPERNEYSLAPNVDAVEEFKVQTNAFSAEYGMTGGGVINIVSKSGTNEFHGNMFEFLRNDKLDAAGWTNNRSGLRKAPIRYNQFGGSWGGPVYLPGYSGKDKTFFFTNYEAIRYSSSVTTQARVATPLERRGDFSQTYVLNPASRQFALVQLFDPDTTRANPSGSGLVRTPFPNSVLPASRLDPVALKALTYVPEPNRPAEDLSGRNNYARAPGSTTRNDQFTAKIDHQLTTNHKLFGRYSFNDVTSNDPPWSFGEGNIADPTGAIKGREAQNAVVGITSILSPRTMNELRLAANRQWVWSNPAGMNKNATQELGLPAIVPSTLFPRFVVDDSILIGNNMGQLALRGNTVLQVTNSTNMTRGRHNLKIGFDVRFDERNKYQPGPVSGEFNFLRGTTNNPQSPNATGFGIATFALGAVTSGRLVVGLAASERYYYYAGFIQDDIKVTPRLTLNAGFRYDIITAPRERYNRYSNFNPTAINPVTKLPGLLEFAGVNFGRTVDQNDYNNFGPRLGLAYDLFGGGRTVLRAAYGIFYFHSATFAFPDTLGFSATTSYASPDGLAPSFRLRNGPPNVIQPPGSADGPASFLGNAVSIRETNTRAPYVQQWNFGIQQAVGNSGLLLEAVYAGSHTLKAVTQGYSLRQLDPRYLSLGFALDDRVANPMFGLIPPGTPLSNATISRQQSLLDFPAYNGVNVLNPHLGNSIYHSGQFRVEKRFSQGLSVLGVYTVSKLIGDIGLNIISFAGAGEQFNISCGQNTLLDRRSCRAIEPQDVSQIFTTSGLWELPVGRGKAFAPGSKIASAILGDWQVNGILTMQTGIPLAVRGANNRAADRPDTIANPELPADQRTPDRWFNTAAFVQPPLFTYGNTARTLPNVRGPGMASVDFSIFKSFRFSERWKLQFRSEFFNLFNRVNFGLPNTNFTAGGFGVITTAGLGRRAQFGLKLVF